MGTQTSLRQKCRIVRTRQEHDCLLCGSKIRKSVKAKVYPVPGLGRQWFHLTHHSEDIILNVWDLVGIIR